MALRVIQTSIILRLLVTLLSSDAGDLLAGERKRQWRAQNPCVLLRDVMRP